MLLEWIEPGLKSTPALQAFRLLPIVPAGFCITQGIQSLLPANSKGDRSLALALLSAGFGLVFTCWDFRFLPTHVFTFFPEYNLLSAILLQSYFAAFQKSRPRLGLPIAAFAVVVALPLLGFLAHNYLHPREWSEFFRPILNCIIAAVALLHSIYGYSSISKFSELLSGERRGASRLLVSFSLQLMMANALGLMSAITESQAILLLHLIFTALVWVHFVFKASQQSMPGLYSQSRAKPGTGVQRAGLEDLADSKVLEAFSELFEKEKVYLDEDYSLASLASDLGVSTREASGIVRSISGDSFTRIMQEYRVKEACRLLVEEPDRNALSVCYAAGFNSSASFYRAFNRLVGMKPTEFRRIAPADGTLDAA